MHISCLYVSKYQNIYKLFIYSSYLYTYIYQYIYVSIYLFIYIYIYFFLSTYLSISANIKGKSYTNGTSSIVFGELFNIYQKISNKVHRLQYRLQYSVLIYYKLLFFQFTATHPLYVCRRTTSPHKNCVCCTFTLIGWSFSVHFWYILLRISQSRQARLDK